LINILINTMISVIWKHVWMCCTEQQLQLEYWDCAEWVFSLLVKVVSDHWIGGLLDWTTGLT